MASEVELDPHSYKRHICLKLYSLKGYIGSKLNPESTINVTLCCVHIEDLNLDKCTYRILSFFSHPSFVPAPAALYMYIV